MRSWLDRYSELASGDDMTLVFACINKTDEQSIKSPTVAFAPTGDHAKES
jgi:hypothetical protein